MQTKVLDILVVPEGKIVDYVDGVLRPDTPEEYVRQNIEKRIINELVYPRELIAVEKGIKIGTQKPRVDIGIYLKDRPAEQENIHIIVECKKESVTPADKKEGVGQLKSYMSACLNCEWGLWTNGKQREVWRKVRDESNREKFIEVNDIPVSEGSIDDIEKPSRSKLRDAVGDNLLYAFRTAHNSIHVIDGFQKEQAFFELLKIIFCKIYDERNLTHSLEFYVTSSERGSADGQLACKNRINKIFGQVKQRYNQIFDSNDEIKLNPRSLVRIVAEFQGYSFLNSDVDIKGKAYEEIVGSNLKGDRGQFFTPRNVMHMAVEMVNPSADERVIDPACGTGGFLVTAMNRVLKSIEHSIEGETGTEKFEWGVEQYGNYHAVVSEIAKRKFYGFDISPELVRATKMNMVMNNDGSGNILHADSLLAPYEWSAGFKNDLCKSLNVDVDSLTSWRKLEHFDVLITNPPFGSKIVIKDTAILDQYDLGHIWEKPKEKDGLWMKTERLQGGVPPEQLFIERCMQLLKPSGRMAIVLPDSILGSPGLGYIRQWLISQAKIIASIDMHSDTFQPHTGVQTSILVMQKKTNAEKVREQQDGQLPYNVFMAVVNKVGHDKRGNTIFQRDEFGNEVLTLERHERHEGGRAFVTEAKVKIVDDQTQSVVDAFSVWKKSEGITW